MNHHTEEQTMHHHTFRLAAASVALASLMACVAGCQFADFRGSRNAAQRAASRNDGERLSDRQVADVQLSLAHSLEQQGKLGQALEA